MVLSRSCKAGERPAMDHGQSPFFNSQRVCRHCEQALPLRIWPPAQSSAVSAELICGGCGNKTVVQLASPGSLAPVLARLYAQLPMCGADNDNAWLPVDGARLALSSSQTLH